jgi:O-antigen/teichoic acid export membrane protein
MSLAQVVVIGGVLFILYRFLINTIGIERLGIWSVVLAATSLANIANLGLSASVVKFVAKYLARNREELVVGVIQTSAISIAVIVGLALLISYPFADWLLSLVVPVTKVEEAVSVLPYALLSFLIMATASVFQAGLDGYQRIDIRSILIMTVSLIYLILCFLLVPSYGLMGLAYSQVVQTCMVLIGSWLLLKRHLRLLPIIPYQWNYNLFKEMIVYGFNFQVILISQMLCDPVTKALLTKFGGLSMTGFYEMASRMVIQLRALPVAANQVVVPAIADLQEKNKEIIQKIYRDSYRLLLYIVLPIFSAIIAFAPIISQIWIGYYENTFVLFSTLLAVGWFINTLNGPSYFANLGTGELRWNIIGHVTIALLNFGLGFLLGYYYQGIGVVIAWIIALIMGSVIISISYHCRHNIPMVELLPRESRSIGFASIGGLCVSLLLYHYLVGRIILPGTATIGFLAFFASIAIPFWVHPMRKRLMGLVSGELLKIEVGA